MGLPKANQNTAMHDVRHHGVPSHLEGFVHIYAPVVHSVYLDNHCKICRNYL